MGGWGPSSGKACLHTVRLHVLPVAPVCISLLAQASQTATSMERSRKRHAFVGVRGKQETWGMGRTFGFGSSMLLSKSAAQQRGASAAVDVGLCALRLRSLHLFYCSSNCCRIRSFITNARSYSCRLVVRCHAFAVSPCQPQGGCIYQQMPLFVSAAASLQAGTVAQDNLGPESSSSTTSTQVVEMKCSGYSC